MNYKECKMIRNSVIHHQSPRYTHNKYKVFQRKITEAEDLHHNDIIQQDILQKPKNSSNPSTTAEIQHKLRKTPREKGGKRKEKKMLTELFTCVGVTRQVNQLTKSFAAA